MKHKAVYAIVLLLMLYASAIGCQGVRYSAQEILSKSTEAMVDVNSLMFEMEVVQKTAIPGIEEIPMKVLTSVKSIRELQTSEITMQFDIAGETQESMVMYQKDDILYLYVANSGWVYQEIKEDALLLESPEDPFMFIDMLIDVGEKNIKIEKESDYYLLTYEDVGGELAGLMKEQIEKQLRIKLTNDPELEEFFSNTIISNLKYALSIDSDTFLPIENAFAVTLTTEVMGEELIVDQEMRIKYLEYNTLDTIDIPDEVINEAMPVGDILLTSFAVPENRLYEHAAIDYFEVEKKYTDGLNDLGYTINLGAANRSSSLENTPVINTLTLENQAYHTSVIPISGVITADNLEIFYLSLKNIDLAYYIVGGTMIIAGVATAPVTMPAMALAVAKGLVIKVGIEIVGLAAEKMKCAELTYGTIELGAGTYTGDLKDCKPHGQGTATYDNGKKYVGDWKDGYQNGRGTATWPDGDRFVGEFKDNKRHGNGTMTWPDGDRFVGEYKDDKRHGNGTMTWSDGDRFVGEYRNGAQYRGTYIWADGTKETIRP